MSPRTHLNYPRVTYYVIGFNAFYRIKMLCLYKNNFHLIFKLTDRSMIITIVISDDGKLLQESNLAVRHLCKAPVTIDIVLFVIDLQVESASESLSGLYPNHSSGVARGQRGQAPPGAKVGGRQNE